MRNLFLLLALCSLNTFALEKKHPSKTGYRDLRYDKEIFMIKNITVGEEKTYRLESSLSGQFNMKILKKMKMLNSYKVDSVDARKLDDEFVENFISFKYEMNSPEMEKKCKKRYYLSLRGESLSVCESEKSKMKMIEVIIKKLEKKYS